MKNENDFWKRAFLFFFPLLSNHLIIAQVVSIDSYNKSETYCDLFLGESLASVPVGSQLAD